MLEYFSSEPACIVCMRWLPLIYQSFYVVFSTLYLNFILMHTLNIMQSVPITYCIPCRCCVEENGPVGLY